MLGVALAIACVVPAVAAAAPGPTRLTRDGDGVLHLTAAPDARDYVISGYTPTRFVIAVLGSETSVVTDIGDSYFTAASVTASACSLSSSDYTAVVSCPLSDRTLRVDLGDRDDYFGAGYIFSDPPPEAIFLLSVMLSHYRDTCEAITASHGERIDVNAGSGDDMVRGTPGADRLRGGDGSDVLAGGFGTDSISGDAGFDSATFCDHSNGISVTLDGIANDGAVTEGDNVGADVEDVMGGAGNDTIVGSAAANHLSGGAGNDRLVGSGGFDTLAGGAGDDVIDARDDRTDLVECGAGPGDEADVDAMDDEADCEAVRQRQPLVLDQDGDGSPRPVDCNDTSRAIRPGAVDVPDDGIDQNCDGADAVNLDRDGDGSPKPADCDDGDPAVRPTAAEVFGDRVDDDCDGVAQPFPRVSALVSYDFDPASGHLFALDLTQVTAGTHITVGCRNARVCPARIRLRARRAQARMRLGSSLQHVVFRPGSRLTICLSKRNAMSKLVSLRATRHGMTAARPRYLTPDRHVRACR